MRWAALLAALALAGCGEDGDRRRRAPARDEAPRFEPIAGGVGWEALAPLVYRRPSVDMRSAEYAVEGHPEADLAVSYFPPAQGGGGDVRENVRRWVGQLQRAPGDEPRITEREVNDLRVTVVDVRGTFVGRRGAGAGGPPRPGWRLLGAIVEGPRGLVFFKLLGPDGAVERASEAFDRLVGSLHPA